MNMGMGQVQRKLRQHNPELARELASLKLGDKPSPELVRAVTQVVRPSGPYATGDLKKEKHIQRG